MSEIYYDSEKTNKQQQHNACSLPLAVQKIIRIKTNATIKDVVWLIITDAKPKTSHDRYANG
jgi:hypothetical protein